MIITLSACGQVGTARVGLKALTADLVFGIPPVEEPVAPPDTISKPPPAIALPDDDFNFDGGSESGPFCPPPQTNDVDQPRTDVVPPDVMPATGTFLWKVEGYQDFEQAGRFPLSPYTARAVYDVKRLTDPRDFTFKTYQFEIGNFSSVALTWEVYQSRPRGTEAGPPPQGAGANIIRDNPINGIYLTRIVRYTGESLSGEEFFLNPPMLYLPLPVISGFARESVSSDPTSLQSLQMSMQVRNQHRVIGCGKVIDGWLVESTQTFTYTDSEGEDAGSKSVTRKYNYAIATQFGGILTFEHVETPCEQYDEANAKCVPEGKLRYNANLGTTDPDEYSGQSLTPPK